MFVSDSHMHASSNQEGVEMEVRQVKTIDGRNAAWEVRWARSDEGGSYRVRLLACGTFPALSDSFSCR